MLFIRGIEFPVPKIEKHIVVSAPTGSGKTKIFELAIVELLKSLEPANCKTSNVKIVYGNLHQPFIVTIEHFIEICLDFCFYHTDSGTDKGAVQ